MIDLRLAETASRSPVMDFLKILKSFEDFVYEALIWIILLPKTLVKILLMPRRMTLYAATELKADDEDRFSEEIPPPLLLILGVLIAHFVDLAIRAQTPNPSGTLAHEIFSSEQNLLLYRTIAFGAWALAGAVCFLVHTGGPIGRKSLRVPFYEQCYLVAPFALMVSMSSSFFLMGQSWMVAGACLAAAATLWFWLVEIDWIRTRTGVPFWRAIISATLIVLAGSLFNAAVGQVLTMTR